VNNNKMQKFVAIGFTAFLLSAQVMPASATPGQNLTKEQRETQRAARIDIEALNADFTYQLDSGNAGVLANYFTEDGSLGVAGKPRKVGRDAIAQNYAARPAGRITHHVTSNLRLVFDNPTEAHGIRTLTYYATDSDPSKAATPLGVADYTEVYKLGKDGEWRYFSRTVTPVFGLNAPDKIAAATAN
jgi:ketosteroid isomerase-like protein